MTNYEKYETIIQNIDGDFGVNKNTNLPESCEDLACCDCIAGKIVGCTKPIVNWLFMEYIEPPVDWTKVEVDTPVLVSNDNVTYCKRYFAKYKNGRVFVWEYGRTSWSAVDEDDIAWCTYAKLAEKE